MKTLEGLLREHSDKVVSPTSEYKLAVDRSTTDALWHSVVCFYKGAKVKPKKLHHELVVEFAATGEVGVDSGALRKEFFEDAITQADQRLFEGEPTRRIVKKDWGLELMYEVTGMLVAHSVLQEGPGIPCLSPCMYEYILKGEVDDCYPVKEDIPLNLSTHELITFVEEVSHNFSVMWKTWCACSILYHLIADEQGIYRR